MKVKHIVILLGLALYVTSFFLRALNAFSIPGYLCAWNTLILPWGHDGMNILRHEPFQYVAILLSGWINPVFLIVLGLTLANKRRGLLAALTAALILMLPFCWVVIHHEQFRFREAYYLWTASMLLVVLANRLGSIGDTTLAG